MQRKIKKKVYELFKEEKKIKQDCVIVAEYSEIIQKCFLKINEFLVPEPTSLKRILFGGKLLYLLFFCNIFFVHYKLGKG